MTAERSAEETAFSKIAVFGLLFAMATLVASCSGGTSATGSASSAPSPSSSAVPTKFTSGEYGYSLTLPAQWAAVGTTSKWDGRSEVTLDSPQVDEFFSAVDGKGSFAVAAPWKRDLAAYTVFLIAFNHRFHGDTCPPKPSTQTPVTIGSQPGVLLAYDCGILINIATTVRHGVAYQFVFRDSTVQAATDSADNATFMQILRSVQFVG